MQGSKIRLSPAEAALFCNAEVILTKNSIIQKTVALLSSLQEDLLNLAPVFISSNSPSPKISKGENYLGLPYVVLDYPRISQADSLCFVRSLFWWGHFYSSTLQLSGRYKEEFRHRITTHFSRLAEQNYFVGVNPNPWIHHFEETNVQPISNYSQEAFSLLLEQHPHIKIAARWPLNEWDAAANNLMDSWIFLTELIT